MRRLLRALRWIGLGLGAVVLAAGALALFWTLYNPEVPLAEPTVVARTPRGPEITVVLGGDFAPTDAALPAIARHGWRYPYLATADVLRDADVAFANLEAPVTESRRPFPLWKDYLYRVEPEAVEAWTWLGLDVVSLANNHALDYRARGLLDTVRHLDGAGIAHVGGGADETAARRPVIVDVGGTRIGFLGYLEHKAAYNLYLRTYAVGGRPGCAQLNRADVVADVRRLRPRVDVLIASVHWGENYAGVTRAQEAYARLLAELGVDVVAGHHAHDVQPAEWRGRTLVLYSLGNYAWGAPGHGHLRVGLLARLRIAPRAGAAPARLTGVELVPIATQNRIVRFQPRRLEPAELRWLDPFLAGTRARGADAELIDGQIVLPAPPAAPSSDLRVPLPRDRAASDPSTDGTAGARRARAAAPAAQDGGARDQALEVFLRPAAGADELLLVGRAQDQLLEGEAATGTGVLVDRHARRSSRAPSGGFAGAPVIFRARATSEVEGDRR